MPRQTPSLSAFSQGGLFSRLRQRRFNVEVHSSGGAGERSLRVDEEDCDNCKQERTDEKSEPGRRPTFPAAIGFDGMRFLIIGHGILHARFRPERKRWNSGSGRAVGAKAKGRAIPLIMWIDQYW